MDKLSHRKRLLFFALFTLSTFVFFYSHAIPKVYSQACQVPTQVQNVLVTFPSCVGNICNFTQGSCSWDSVASATQYQVSVTEVETNRLVQTQQLAANVTSTIFPVSETNTYRCDVAAVNACGTGPTGTKSLLCVVDASVTITPTNTPTPTPTLTLTPTPTSLPGTQLNFTVFLHGIGKSGDNPNPAFDLSNQNPLHLVRNFQVFVYDSTNTLVVSPVGAIIYNSQAGNFTGSVNIGVVQSGDYIIKAKTNQYLLRLFSPIQAISAGSPVSVPVQSMVAGDIVSDNQLDIKDYNVLLDCGYGAINPLPMTDPGSEFQSANCQSHPSNANVDLNDDGIVDGHDYNLFVRELSVQSGN